MLTVCSLTLGVAFVMKDCPPFLASHPLTSLLDDFCFTDLTWLYRVRSLDRGVFPYIDGDIEGGVPAGGALEYPVLTGLFMWLVGTVSSDAQDYFLFSVLLLFPLGLLTTFLLTGMAGWRALLWAAAPPLALYAFQNWELLVAAAAVTGFWLWRRDQVVLAGFAFGIGAAFKLYPILFLVPLALERWAAADRPEAVRSAAVGIGTFALVNLPFVVASPAGWFATYQFHSLRDANYDSIWRLGVPDLSPDELNLVSTALTAAFVGVALAWGARQAGRYPFLQVCGAMLAGFLLGGKVHSPQYALWILPFFVLLDVRIVWWVAYSLADLTRYVGVTIGDDRPGLGDALLTTGVWVRAGLLLALFVLFLRAKPAEIRPASQPVDRILPSHAPTGLRRTS